MPELAAHLERLVHDLRDPLAPLQISAYLLQRDDLDPERRRELAGIVERQTVRLGSMIGEIGDWARASQSRLVDHRERTELGQLLNLARTAGALQQGGVAAFELSLEPGLDEALVDGDPQRLVQMLGALIAYAGSRTGPEGIRIHGRREGQCAQLYIAERGPETPAEALASLFDAPDPAPFDEGLGLRLLVAQAIAQTHGGRLSAAPDSSGCAEYRVELPLAGDAGAA